MYKLKLTFEETINEKTSSYILIIFPTISAY